jgi:subtilisin-like proprotein convertase family protein
MLEANPALGWRDVQEILIRSAARIRPLDSDWATNGAGLAFNHQFGAGLIDAAAAVALAAAWTPLPAAAPPVVETRAGLALAIPENNAGGVSHSFDLAAAGLRVEQVTLKANITHSARGNLEITLTSPTGMTSRLAEVHSDSNDHYDWTFSSVRHWGESAAGLWTVKIADRSSSGNSSGGTVNLLELTLHGTPGVAVNPPPQVQLTSPEDGRAFSPGAVVEVAASASDLAAGGGPGEVAAVEFLVNGELAATVLAPPYGFVFQPPPGVFELRARAIDNEGAEGQSAGVTITVANQPPAISAAVLDAAGQAWADRPLAVASVAAADPEGAGLDYSYQWQSAGDDGVFAVEAGATGAVLPPLPARAGRLWRCLVAASDGELSSPPFATAAVNLLARPRDTALAGGAYAYAGGLVLRGGGPPVTRRAILHEFSQGPVGGSAEWIELLALESGGLAGWQLTDAAGGRLVFAEAALWQNLPPGTLVVVYNGVARDPLLPPDDEDSSDGRVIVAANDPRFFAAGHDAWLPLGNTGDAIFLRDPQGSQVHAIAYGSSAAASPNIGAAGSGRAAFFTGDSDAGADLAAHWLATSSTVARRGSVRAAGDLFISEYVEGSSNNKFIELFNPSGQAVDLGGQVYKLELYYNGSTSVGRTLPLQGTVAAGGTFVIKHSLAATGVPAQQVWTNLDFNGNDALVLRKGAAVADSFGRVGEDPGAEWTGGGVRTANRTLRRKSWVVQGDTVPDDAFDPSLEWGEWPQDAFDGLGSHSTSAGPVLALAVEPATFAETAGPAAALASLSVAPPPAADLTVILTSTNPGLVAIPAQVTIPAGLDTTTFAVGAVDNDLSGGTAVVTLSAEAAGHATGSFAVTVTDDEPTLEGVTPGAPNSPPNAAFVAALRDGSHGAAAAWRLGAGAVLPAGLALDPATGLLAGTIDPAAAPGAYPVEIERFNPLGESVSQSFTLSVLPAGGYWAWVAGFPDLADPAPDADPDHDGLPNLVEYALASDPGHPAAPHPLATGSGPAGLELTFRVDKAAADVAIIPEWSADPADAPQWSPEGIFLEVIDDQPSSQLRRATLPRELAGPRGFLRLRGAF